MEKKRQQKRQQQLQATLMDFFPGPAGVGLRLAARLGMLGPEDPLLPFEEAEQIRQEEKLLRQQQQQEQERRKRHEMMLQQQHRHDPVDSLGYDGALHLYLKRRNMRTHREAKELVTRIKTLTAPPIREESLSDRVRRADFNDYEPYMRKSLELPFHSVVDLGDRKCTKSLAFHPYEALLVAADDENSISICNFEEGKKYGSFSNRNPSPSKLTSVSWINETSKSLLLTGAGDGVARVWSGVAEADVGEKEGGRMRPPELVTAFHALPPAGMQMNSGDLDKAGLVTHWQQRRGLLSAAGACRQLNVWDLASEQLWTEWEVPEGSAVSALRAPTDDSPGPLGGWVMAAGMTDGEVLLYDAREKGQSTVSRMLKLQGWVLDVYFTDGGGGHEILTGCADGHVTTQDIRKAADDSYEPFTAKVQRTLMTAFTMHPRVPVLATGSYKQFINIITPRGELLSRIKGHTGLFDQRLGCVTSLAFHPNQLMLAAGTTDQVLSIFAHDGSTPIRQRAPMSSTSAVVAAAINGKYGR
ncbi:unnamed protein product [Scytosiphon promiscuus]